MSMVVPLDEFVQDEGYPGFDGAFDHAPWLVERFGRFTKADEGRFWFLDFHWPRGLTPLGLLWNTDGYSWGTQSAAESLPLPSGRGIAQRIGGTHTYAATIDVEDAWEMAERNRRLQRKLPRFLRRFDSIWTTRRDEINRWWKHLKGTDLPSLSLAELGRYLLQARRFHKRAFEIHFEMMYPLLANYVEFHTNCVEMGLDPGQIAKFLQGYNTAIMDTDRALWDLTRRARTAGLREVFARTDAPLLRAELAARGGKATSWLSEFDEFLRVHGHRTEGACDVALPSWVEDPTPPLGIIKTFMEGDTDHDFQAAHEHAVAEREEAIDAARTRLTAEEQRVFDAGLASCQMANFPWWQDDHNHYIDLRVSLPLRWGALRVAEMTGTDRPDDTLFLFWPELMAITSGETGYDQFRRLIELRRQYFEHWAQRRTKIPKVLGAVPDTANDPILIEIFGLNQNFLSSVHNAHNNERSPKRDPLTTLTGLPAAKGIARGRAIVLTHADELHRVRPGEVLVCESTSPNWTPAFSKIAACVCDSGGTLSHAAIVGREYQVPTVTAVAYATHTIRNGDDIEVNGNTGHVIIHTTSHKSRCEQTVSPERPIGAVVSERDRTG